MVFDEAGNQLIFSELVVHILEHNCHNNDYELLQAKEDESPLETVFRSMSAAVVEDISSALQKEIEAKTGRNPLKDPWVLK